VSRITDMRYAVVEQLDLIVEGKPHAATLATADEMRAIERRSQCWYRATNAERGVQVLAVFGIADCDVYYCRSAP